MHARDTHDIYLKQGLSNKEAAAVFIHEWTHTQGGNELEAWTETVYAMKKLGLEKLNDFEANKAFHPNGTINRKAIESGLRKSSNPAYNPNTLYTRGPSSPSGVRQRFEDW